MIGLIWLKKALFSLTVECMKAIKDLILNGEPVINSGTV